MNRYRSYGRLDETKETLGDGRIVRLDMRTDPATLPPGAVQRCENFRFDTVGTRVRAGISRQLGEGVPVEQIRHACVYRPDNSHDRIALICEEKMYLFDPSTQSLGSELAYPKAGGSYDPSEQILVTDRVWAVQGGDASTMDLYILRGFSKVVLEYTGGGAVAENAAFEQGEFGVYYGDRMAVNATRQSVAVSDYLDFDTWTTLNQFVIGKGGDERLVGMRVWQKDYVIIASDKRFHIGRFAPNIGTGGYEYGLNVSDSFLRQLTSAGGLLGPNAWIEAAGFIWFLSDTGIYRFVPQLDLELTDLGEPISTPIQPIMDRLNTEAAWGSAFALHGHRIYIALPVNDEPIAATGTVDTNVITFVTESAHGLSAGEEVNVTGANDTAANGTLTVASVADSTTFTVSGTLDDSDDLGQRIEIQRLADRNNVIAVYNLAETAWESIDLPPAGLRADWLFPAQYLTGKRLWLIDRDQGPCLYEQGPVDELSDIVGGVDLPFDLPVELSAASFSAAPIPGRLKSRAYRWGADARKVLAGEARLTCRDGDAGVLTVTVQSPDQGEWSATRTFDDSQEDTAARKRCGRRGLEAVVEVVTTAGRPTVRTLSVDVAHAGRVKEE